MSQDSSRFNPPPLPPRKPVGNPYAAPLAEPKPPKSSSKPIDKTPGNKPESNSKAKKRPSQNLLSESIESAKQLVSQGGFFTSRIGLRALELFCQRASIGIRSGVDILRLFESEKKSGNKQYRIVMEDVQTRIRDGETLADAMANAGGYFPVLLIQMVHAGELAGGLDRIFGHMSDYYRELRLARNEFWSQLTWPIIQLCLAIGVISIMILLQGMLATGPVEHQFDALGLGLKGTNGVMIFWCWVLACLGIIFLIYHLVRNNFLQCHRWMMPVALKLPVLGSVFNNTALARLSMTLSMLLNAGVDAIRCVRQSFLSTGSDYYIQGMPAALEAVQRGDSLAVSFESSQVVPREFIQGIEVGELSGNETESLEHLVSEYQRRAKTSLTQLSYIASTTVWVVIAGIIVFFIFRIASNYLGMFNSVLQM